MPKKNRVAIYEYLFKEGVLVAKKDFTAPKHPEIDVPNLHVIKALTVSDLYDSGTWYKARILQSGKFCEMYWVTGSYMRIDLIPWQNSSIV